MINGALYTVAKGDIGVIPYATTVTDGIYVATISAGAQQSLCVISNLPSRYEGGFKIDPGDWIYDLSTYQLRKINTVGNLNDPMATGTDWTFTVDPPFSDNIAVATLQIIKASSVPKLWIVAEGWDGNKGGQIINPMYDVNSQTWLDTPIPFVGNSLAGVAATAWITNTDPSGINTNPIVMDCSNVSSTGAYASGNPLGF